MQTPPRLTLKGLLPLAKHCPLLKSLCLSLHLSPPDYVSREIGRDLRCEKHALHRMEIRYWTRIPDHEVAANFLLDLFPSIYPRYSFVYIGDDNGEESSDLMKDWRQFGNVYERLEMVRRQESLWELFFPSICGMRLDVTPQE